MTRFLDHWWVAVASLVFMLVGLPGTLQSANTWLDWLAAVPQPVASVFTAVGGVVLVSSLYAMRGAIARLARTLASASGAAVMAFRRGSLRPAVLADLDSGATFESDRWEILPHTLRRTGMVAGEASPTLIGMARVKELGGGNRHLNMYVFADRDGGRYRSYTEWRTEESIEQVVRRRTVVKLDGEKLSDETVDPRTTPAVFDYDRLEEHLVGRVHSLLETGDVITVLIDDTMRDSVGGEHTFCRDVLKVPVRGYNAALERLHARASSVLRLSR